MSNTESVALDARIAEVVAPLLERIEKLERRSRVLAVSIMQAGMLISQEVQSEPVLGLDGRPARTDEAPFIEVNEEGKP